MEREERKFSKDFFFFPSTQNFPPTLLRQFRRRREENTLSPLAQMPGSLPFMTRKFAFFEASLRLKNYASSSFQNRVLSREITRSNPHSVFPSICGKNFRCTFFSRYKYGKERGAARNASKRFFFFASARN